VRLPLHRCLPKLLVGEFQLPGRARSSGPQETHEVLVSTKSEVAQAQLQAGDNPSREVYALLRFELSGVALAQEQAVQPYLSTLFAALSFEGMIELAAGLPIGVLGGIPCPGGHKGYLPCR
jgi:hypothetical protein